MKMSIVTTSYQSTLTIVNFVERMHISAKDLQISYELIIVDDGSTDDTKDKTRQLITKFKNTRLIELSRNFGHHQAILLGLDHAEGEYIFLIDSDLEEAPELLGRFYSEILNTKADVVYGVSDKHGVNWLQKASSNFFWEFFRKHTKLEVPKGICTVRIMNRQYVNSLLQHREVNVFLAGLWVITGYQQKPIIIEKVYKGTTNYTFGKRLDLALTSLISFTGRPLRLIAVFGALTVFVALLLLLTLIFGHFIFEGTSQGWLSVITLIVLFGGFQILAIGMVAIYVASILEEVKARPRAIVSKIWPEE